VIDRHEFLFSKAVTFGDGHGQLFCIDVVAVEDRFGELLEVFGGEGISVFRAPLFFGLLAEEIGRCRDRSGALDMYSRNSGISPVPKPS
jgi:hypothetical protein